MTTERTVAVGGSTVHVLLGGAGPAVLLLHGSGPGTTGSGAWAPTIDALGDRFQFVAPDQAGFGRTPLPPGSRGGLATWTRQAAELMAALGHESYAVVGHSMGGAVALALAAAQPERVTRVVAVSTMGAPGAGLSPGLDAVWAAPATRDGARRMLELLFADPSLVTDEAIDARVTAMRAGAEEYSRLFPPPRERWAEDLTLSERTLAAIRQPVLLVQGAADRVTPLGAATLALLEHLPDARLHVFGRCGHAPTVERPVEFRSLLERHLA